MIFNLDKPIKTKMFGNVYQKCGGWHNGRTTNYHAIIYCTDGEFNMKIENDICSFTLQARKILFDESASAA